MNVLFFLLISLAATFATLSAQATEIQKVISPGGIEAWLAEDHTNPLLAMRFAWRGGAALDPVGKDGLARFVASTLDEGAGDLDSQAFQRRLDDLAITLRFETGRDTFGGRLRTLSENRTEAFRLLALAVTHPRFDDKSVERLRRSLLSGLRQASVDPGEAAGRRLFQELFPDHAYGRSVDGTQKSISDISRQDLKAFAKQRLRRGGLVIGVAGDVTPADLGVLLDSAFGGLQAGTAPWKLPSAKAPANGKVVLVDMDVPQSVILFAQKGPLRKDRTFYAAYVLNHILGGGSFSSILYDQVREERGLAYSVGTSLYPLDSAGLWMGHAGTANARVGKTLDVIQQQWKRVAENGVTAQQLADAKTYLTGSFPLRFSSSMGIAGILAAMQLDGLGIDYLKKRNGYIEAVTLKQTNRLARKTLSSKALTWVVVGRPDGVGVE